MTFDEMAKAVRDAEEIMRRADYAAETMARMLIGRLRKVPDYILKDLKKELRDFNMTTREWR